MGIYLRPARVAAAAGGVGAIAGIAREPIAVATPLRADGCAHILAEGGKVVG
jgi:hypothetical protein